MRLPVRCLEITSVERARSEMELVGVDPAGIRIMAPKQFHYNLKVEGLTPAQANIIKQDMLSIGGEAAVARGVAACAVRSTDAVISGTLSQFGCLIEKLGRQCLGLPAVAAALKEAIDNSGRKSFTIRGRARSWEAGPRALIMGVLNVTPDSFSDGGRFFNLDAAVEKAVEMVKEGADWIDVGGESTRPGALEVSVEEELNRVIPVIEALSASGITVSVDTTKARVAARAVEAGAEIVNDVSALSMDGRMAEAVAECGAALIMMHRRGTPRTMQQDTVYGDLVSEVYNYLLSRIDYAQERGIDADKIIIDPGLGFGKSTEGNLEIIRRLSEFRSLGAPILIGTSRKSFIGKTLGGLPVDERLYGTIAAHVIALRNGASVLRVHDVKETRQAADMASAVLG